MAASFATVEAYIGSFPDDVQVVLERVRQAILAAAPGAGEKIAYQIPTVTLDGTSLVHFAGWKHHIAVYPLPAGDEAFERDVAPYRAARSTARFPLGRPVPYDLIERIVRLLVDRHEG